MDWRRCGNTGWWQLLRQPEDSEVENLTFVNPFEFKRVFTVVHDVYPGAILVVRDHLLAPAPGLIEKGAWGSIKRRVKLTEAMIRYLGAGGEFSDDAARRRHVERLSPAELDDLLYAVEAMAVGYMTPLTVVNRANENVPLDEVLKIDSRIVVEEGSAATENLLDAEVWSEVTMGSIVAPTMNQGVSEALADFDVLECPGGVE